MEVGRPKEVLVVEDSMKFSKGQSKLKWLLAIAVGLAALVILFIGLYENERQKLKDTEKKDAGLKMAETAKALSMTTSGTDVTMEKVQVAAGVVSRMNLKVNPCEDFYQYSCGGWLDKTSIPDSKAKYNIFSELGTKNDLVIKMEMEKIINGKVNVSSNAINNAIMYYLACLNTASIERRNDQPIKDLIKEFNSWPVTDASFNVSTWNWTDTFVKAHKFLSISPIFGMFIGLDRRNSSNSIIVVFESGTVIAREDHLSSSTYHKKKRNAYKKLMKDIAVLLGANKTGIDLMDQVYEFEKKLANVSSSSENILKLKDFANYTKIPLPWLKNWFNFEFAEVNHIVKDNDYVSAFSIDYIRDAYRLFNEESPLVQSSYIMWEIIREHLEFLPGRYKQAYKAYNEAIKGTIKEPTRTEFCLSSTQRSHGFALGRLFVDKMFQPSAKTVADEMVGRIRKSFIENIDTLTWMDGKTKSVAKEKAKAIIENVGYPSFIMKDVDLDAHYKGLIVRKNMYFENVISYKRFALLENYKRIGKKNDKTLWTHLPWDFRSYYSLGHNKIVFPAGILQPPFYDHRAPRALNYGAIGVVVARGITHGFDDQGKNFNKEGNSKNWWSPESENGFKTQAKCLVDQYSKYSLYGRNLNGNQTLGENIADNGGSKAAFKAYREWVKANGAEKRLPGIDLSPEQLFFVGFAQVWCSKYRESAAISQIENGVHSISKFRVIGTLHNSKEFSEVFKCPPTSYMNQKPKCSVF